MGPQGTLPVRFFQNDEAIINFLGARNDLPLGDHKARFAIELNSVAYFGEGAKSFSHKIMENINRSSSENHSVALLDSKKVKIKDVSKGENLFEAPEDGRLDTLPLALYHEKSSMLVEKTIPANLGTEEQPKIIHLAESLTPEERIEHIQFYKERQVNFAWSYADMPGLDPDLVMHHLSLPLGAKPVKKKLRKMHPHVALLDPKKVKIKDVSKGENLSKTPKDGRLDTLLLELYHEKSSMLVEKTILTNLGTNEKTKIIHLVESLTPKERIEHI